VNTFATSQSVEALQRSWLPVARVADQVCTTVGPTPSVSTSTPTAGGTMTISGDGFAPGASLTIVLHSDPVVLATATADANGAYSATVTIPVETTPGTHQIVVSGLGPDGQPRESVVTIEVQATPQVLAAVATAPGSVVSIQPTFTG
jgi:alpha-L-fucosidase